ncbi:MAG: carboxypeptidase-like regulatory domain-containing protein, partial [Planctomycetaceae bacterium]|nr:carboxypeptidase-like regulatory domain-containing protein [Planctomycetaceae bacterium]
MRAIDADSGETIKNVQINQLKCDQFPSSYNGNWWQFYESSVVTHLFPGRYNFSVSKSIQFPEDRVYTPVNEKYGTEIIDGKESVVEVKLRSRSQTEEELNKRWRFIITGTVRDLEDKPLPFAKIKITGFSSPHSGSASVTADENGYYSFRFSNDMITSMHRTYPEKPTQEKPNVLKIAITASHSGFVWKGIRTADGNIVSDQFLIKEENLGGKFYRNDWHYMSTVEPEPTDQVKKTHNYHQENAVYPLKPTEINMVMQPSVHFDGVVEFDEQPEKLEVRHFWKHAEVIFDLPRAERASDQPVFYGELNDNFRFEIDVLPQDIDVQFAISSFLPKSWQNDSIVSKTDFFKLPPTGNYKVVLHWKTETKN